MRLEYPFYNNNCDLVEWIHYHSGTQLGAENVTHKGINKQVCKRHRRSFISANFTPRLLLKALDTIGNYSKICEHKKLAW